MFTSYALASRDSYDVGFVYFSRNQTQFSATYMSALMIIRNELFARHMHLDIFCVITKELSVDPA